MDIFLLDVGQTKYGDCIVVRHGGRSILIDAAHLGDMALISRQLSEIFGSETIEVDLLVVTHCHSDHIGCMPSLVKSGTLTAKTAVVADEKLGFGRDSDGAGGSDALALSDGQRAVVLALQEEDHSDLPTDELVQFLQDAASLADRYSEMLDTLAESGTKVLRFGKAKASEIKQVEKSFADFGLTFLGPTQDHLVRCAEVIARADDAVGQKLLATQDAADDAPGSVVATYRALAPYISSGSDIGFASDRPGPGAAKNDQSIVLRLAADGWSALLAGDMQFVKAEVSGLTPLMTALRQTAVDAGPYDFIKFSHHSSYNGVDESLLNDFGSTKLFAHTGGLHDPDHPDPSVLELLKNRRGDIRFARTDRNGLITVSKEAGGVKLKISRGRVNDFTPNPANDQPPTPTPKALAKSPKKEPATPSIRPPAVRQPIEVASAEDDDVVEVIARVPHKSTRVTITIDVAPASKKNECNGSIAPDSAFQLGGGRRLDGLLFVTSTAVLARNIGSAEAAAVVEVIKKSGCRLVDLPADTATAEDAATVLRPHLSGALTGVVLVGGYDVVPAQKIDVLDATLRAAITAAGQIEDDADKFIVWSDDLYGDFDGDFLPELPVSRVPDGRSAEVVFAALGSLGPGNGKRFGVRNINRPFAESVFKDIPGQGNTPLGVSERLSPADIAEGAVGSAVYFMLHGSARDGSRFWGEIAATGEAYEALDLSNIPASVSGSTVFAGCCWGALVMSPPAANMKPGTELRPRGPEASIAVAYLRAGATAFVGCTGSHYSPLTAPYNFFGKPMHDAFWRNIRDGRPPATALFEAKREFAALMPHGRKDAFSQGIELKILRQFTCLGLGW